MKDLAFVFRGHKELKVRTVEKHKSRGVLTRHCEMDGRDKE